VLKGGSHHHHPESFLADEDINLSDKLKSDQEDVDSDDETIQISNISHTDVAHEDNCLIHQQATISGGNGVTTQQIDLFNEIPSPFHHCHNKPMLTRIIRLYLHLMTKLNYFDGTTVWGMLPSPC
jgi:hypothetical protein